EAIKNGAVAIVAEINVQFKQVNVPVIEYTCTREALSLLSANFYGNAHKELKIIGITGTNGKTTSTYMLKSILEAVGKKAEVIGTNNGVLTTPDPQDLHRRFKKMQDDGCEYVVMEVSAHAIFYKKIEGIRFAAVSLTNITEDHLDFFKTMEEYKNTKLSFITPKRSDIIVSGYSLEDVSEIKLNISESSFKYKEQEFSLKLAGEFNILNALGCIMLAEKLGISLEDCALGLKNLTSVDGRFDRIETNEDFSVIIDYAHTPDGMLNILKSVRKVFENSCKIICVFGCGGNRDQKKRPIMGYVATNLANHTIITSDNPRFENPMDIIEEIKTGIRPNAPSTYEVVEDREQAIKKAIELARTRPKSVVLVLGKGQEREQEIMGVKHVFSDHEVVSRFLC
ncbi:MAG: UDP-N-acetylmuramoyl-L-alanyl-D-glutamate--2,6-diaminopimelate ligase, partial [Firmicutes bacterium]|nr:UDP-N-acetylmuramoyl-L-alanyl-D-glutamate--2,6-diaminopimelate ligase [Bacillota bacterium]